MDVELQTPPDQGNSSEFNPESESEEWDPHNDLTGTPGEGQSTRLEKFERACVALHWQIEQIKYGSLAQSTNSVEASVSVNAEVAVSARERQLATKLQEVIELAAELQELQMSWQSQHEQAIAEAEQWQLQHRQVTEDLLMLQVWFQQTQDDVEQIKKEHLSLSSDIRLQFPDFKYPEDDGASGRETQKAADLQELIQLATELQKLQLHWQSQHQQVTEDFRSLQVQYDKMQEDFQMQEAKIDRLNQSLLATEEHLLEIEDEKFKLEQKLQDMDQADQICASSQQTSRTVAPEATGVTQECSRSVVMRERHDEENDALNQRVSEYKSAVIHMQHEVDTLTHRLEEAEAEKFDLQQMMVLKSAAAGASARETRLAKELQEVIELAAELQELQLHWQSQHQEASANAQQWQLQHDQVTEDFRSFHVQFHQMQEDLHKQQAKSSRLIQNLLASEHTASLKQYEIDVLTEQWQEVQAAKLKLEQRVQDIDEAEQMWVSYQQNITLSPRLRAATTECSTCIVMKHMHQEQFVKQQAENMALNRKLQEVQAEKTQLEQMVTQVEGICGSLQQDVVALIQQVKV